MVKKRGRVLERSREVDTWLKAFGPSRRDGLSYLLQPFAGFQGIFIFIFY